MKAPPKPQSPADVGIAAAGGFIIAVLVLLMVCRFHRLDLARSPVRRPVLLLEGNSIFYLGAKYLVFGRLLPAPGPIRASRR